jgi:hypothetical protein
MIAGSPDTVAAHIESYGTVGVRHMSLLFNFGFMTAEESGQSLELFLEEVLPRFSPRSSAPDPR